MKVAQYLNVSVDYLLGNTDEPMSHKGTTEIHSAISELSQVLLDLENATSIAKTKIHEICSKLDGEIAEPREK